MLILRGSYARYCIAPAHCGLPRLSPGPAGREDKSFRSRTLTHSHRVLRLARYATFVVGARRYEARSSIGLISLRRAPKKALKLWLRYNVFGLVRRLFT